jgi:hypothetical protein
MGVSDGPLQYCVSCRREQDTCTARLTPDTVVDAPGLGPDEIAGLKLLVVLAFLVRTAFERRY